MSVANIDEATIKVQVTMKIPLDKWKKAKDLDESMEFSVDNPGEPGSQILMLQFYPKNALVYVYVNSNSKMTISWACRFDQEGGVRGPVRLEERVSYDLRVKKRVDFEFALPGGSIEEHVLGGIFCLFVCLLFVHR